MAKAASPKKDKQNKLDPMLFRRAADSSLDGLAIVNLTGHILYANEARARMHGYEPDELIGRCVFELYSSDTNAEKMAEQVVNGGHWDGECVGLRKDGSTFPMWQAITRVDDVDGNPVAILSVTRDITERREAERRIERAQQLYKDLVENTMVGVYRTALDGRILYFNDPAAELYGLSHKEEAPNYNIKDFYADPEDRKTLISLLNRQGHTSSFEIRMRTMSNEPVTVLVSASLLDGTISGVIMDITQKKIYEESLRRTSQQLIELLDASRELNSSLDITTVLQVLIRHAMSLTSASRGAAGLYVANKMIFKQYCSDGQFIPVDYSFKAGYGVPGWVIEHRMPYLTNDAEHDPQVIPHVRKELGFDRLIDMPIISPKGNLLGCFELHNSYNEREFTDEDVAMLSGVAHQTAIALSNAKLTEELKRTAEELQESEETLRLVVEGSVGFFFYMHDTEGIFKYVSPSVEDMTGHDVEEWKSHYTRFLTDNPMNEDAIRNTERMINTGEPIPPYPVEVFAKDGRRIMLEAYERPIIREGKVVGIQGVARDVTDLRRAEQAEQAIRKESEEYLRNFYRDTILSVTDGKLSISDYDEVESLITDPIFPPFSIREPQDVAMAREEVALAARQAGMDFMQVDNLVLCVGEAATNALKHAGGGTLAVSDTGTAFRVEIKDSGPGMDSLALPKLTLMRGFSTKKSLGMGYATVLALADNVHLATGPEGTAVVIEVAKQYKEPGIDLEKLPDLW